MSEVRLRTPYTRTGPENPSVPSVLTSPNRRAPLPVLTFRPCNAVLPPMAPENVAIPLASTPSW